jgi:hypothetical protein
MPSSIGKSLGPIMTAAGIAAAFIPGGQAFAVPLITAGASSMISPSGVLGTGTTPTTPTPPPNAPVAAPTGPPPAPELATASGGGQAFPAVAPGGDQSSQIASNMMANNPFAAFA